MTGHGHLRGTRSLAAALIVAILALGCGSVPPASPPAPSDPVGASASPSPGASSVSAPACGKEIAPGLPTAAWWGDRVFYEIFVRSFQDSDGDGIGDLAGLTSRLDYLADLGITGLWLMPVAESPSYHGYDVVDYRAVEADYGTGEDFQAFVAAAHERGIAVIVDFVINHTSRDHPWFRDARTPGSTHDDWYVWAEERPGFARDDGSRIWHPDGDRFYYGYFWEGMPDLNVANPAVQAEIDAIGAFWLDEMGVDGFRLDAARHLIEDGEELQNTPATFEWLAAFRDRIHATHPDALVLGEVWDASRMSARYVTEGALDLTFDFGLASGAITAVGSGRGGAARAALREVAELYPPGGLATFLTNHDQNRAMTELGGDLDRAKLAATLLLTGPGTPFVYYGEEIGLTGQKPDERIRTPMRWTADGPGAGFTTGTPWQPLGDDAPGTDVATQTADPASLLATYRELIALRTAQPALSGGGLVPVATDDEPLVAFLRDGPNADVLVVVNLGDTAIDAPRLELDEGPLCGTPVAAVLRGEGEVSPPQVTAAGGFADYAPIARLGPMSAAVIELAQP